MLESKGKRRRTKLNNIKILEKVVTGRAIISDNVLWNLIGETINTDELIEDVPPDPSIIHNHHERQEENKTKGLTPAQKEAIKVSLNKLKAILEIEESEEKREKARFQDNINEPIQELNQVNTEETFNYKDEKQVNILLNAARIELF